MVRRGDLGPTSQGLEDESFDTVTATCVFCSVADPVSGLREIRRMLDARKDTRAVCLPDRRCDLQPRGAGYSTDRRSGGCPHLPTVTMDTPDDQAASVTGTVEWYDAERGVGVIRPDDGTAPCKLGADMLRACGIASLAPGDRVRFRVRDEDCERTATDLALLHAIHRWENEGGAIRYETPDP